MPIFLPDSHSGAPFSQADLHTGHIRDGGVHLSLCICKAGLGD